MSASDLGQLEQQQRTGMRSAIMTQCCGMLGRLFFDNSVMLLFLTALAFSSENILTLLAVPFLTLGILNLPAAYLADHYGKKFIGNIGNAMMVAGYCMIVLSAFFVDISVALAGLVIGGVIFFSIGQALFGGGWFGLLSPVVPEDERGRFFGKLRFSWQLVSLVFTLAFALFLTRQSPVWILQLVVGVAVAGLVFRTLFYQRIPELEPARPKTGIAGAFAQIVRSPGFMPFCAYVFLLALSTALLPIVFGLMEKDGSLLNLGDQNVLILGIVTALGSTIGFWLAGMIIDRSGTKTVFLSCHLVYAMSAFLYLFRGIFSGWVFPYLVFVHLLLGLARAGSSVAISTELFGLIPKENKAISTSICTTMLYSGTALSSLFGAWALKLGFLRDRWSFLGFELSRYDTILLASGILTLLLVVTLGLVPSVIKQKARWLPRA